MLRYLPALALLAATPAHADEDRQVWAAVLAQGSLKGDLWLWLEGQARFTDDVSRLGQSILRPAIGVRFAPDSTVLAGYAYVPTDPLGGRLQREHRPWQQVQFPLVRGRDGRPLLVNRTRLEQRMVVGADRTGWRLRQLVRAQVPIAREGAVQAIGWAEGFFNLNTTDFGARRGVDQWRTFAGVGLPLGGKVRIEPGYLNQRVFRVGENRTNHIASTTLTIGF